jgi:hypothetical protein
MTILARSAVVAKHFFAEHRREPSLREFVEKISLRISAESGSRSDKASILAALECRNTGPLHA